MPGKDDFFVLGWVVRHVLPVAALMIAGAALILAIRVQSQNLVLNMAVQTLQQAETRRQWELVNRINHELSSDTRKWYLVKGVLDSAQSTAFKPKSLSRIGAKNRGR